jgi:hypothetical protein
VRGRNLRAVLIGSLGLAFSGVNSLPASAQVTPSDVRDLVGARAAGAEGELASRGYINVGGSSGDDRRYTYWWNERRGVCLTVATADGRYSSVVSSPAAGCRQDAGGGAFHPPEFGYGGAAGRGDYREHIALICYGEGQKLGAETRSGYEWDADKRRYVPKSGVQWTNQDYNTSVTIEIDGDRGRIRPAKNMLPPINSGDNGGWYDINSLSVSRDMIRGEFRLNGLNKPRLMIDRRAGRITVDGLTKFAGTCDPLDGDRKF